MAALVIAPVYYYRSIACLRVWSLGESSMHRKICAAAIIAAGAFLQAEGVASAGKAKLDATLYTLYNFYDGSEVKLSLSVCGTLPASEGCYGGYEFPEVHRPCAVIEGEEKQKGNVVTRAIYVFDKHATSQEALLDVYVRTDTITDESDVVNVTLQAQLRTSIGADPKAKCFMAASPSTVYVGTDASPAAGVVNIATMKIKNVSGFGSVQAITADTRGYVTVSFGSGFDTFDPQGNLVVDGGGTTLMANTRDAIIHN
jgi:hypothetical protein